MKVDITEAPEHRVATLRHVGPYNTIKEAFDRLVGIAGQAGLFSPDALMLAIYHDDPRTTPEAQLRSDAAITVSSAAKVPAALTESRIPGGPYAVTTHVGPYETLPDSWRKLAAEWLPTSGHRRRDGAGYELYRNDPTNTPKEKLITEIYVPVD